MESIKERREKKLYPAVGVIVLITLIYLSFNNTTTDTLTLPSFLIWQPKMGFVSTNSTHFIVINNDGEIEDAPLYINGWNSYWLMAESVWPTSRPRVSKMLKRGAEMGMTVCRTWAFNDGSSPNSLQSSPGLFNERVFRGLDYVIVEARRNGIRLILSLVNNLNAFGGKSQYVSWARDAGINVSSLEDPFFLNPNIRDYYKAYVKAIVTRKNSITGVRYADEPSIFAWELMNEPRCASSSCAPILQAWITEMAAYVKSLDKKHLVTVGLEGFYGINTTNKSDVNPGEWAAALGLDFIRNSAIENIDFASVHAYPDSWIPNTGLDAKVNYLSRWMESHIHDGDSMLKKPVLFTEVGSTKNMSKNGVFDRDVLFNTTFDRILESAKSRQAGAGVLIWQLLVGGVDGYGDEFSFVPWNYPSTYRLIKEHSCRLRRIVSQGKSEGSLHHSDICVGYQ